MPYRCILPCSFALLVLLGVTGAHAQSNPAARTTTPTAGEKSGTNKAPEKAPSEYTLGSGDSIRIQVFQNPDLSLETRVSESGTITYPLIGSVAIGGLAVSKAESRIAKMLDDGGFVIKPQVTINILHVVGNAVSALGQFNKPGRFPLDTTQTRLSDVMAQAGGVAQSGAETLILVGQRDGKPLRREIDVTAMFMSTQEVDDPLMLPGDVIYVHRAPQVYIYGEVQRPGVFRLERNMTVMQALAEGGGLTARGTQRHVRVHRRGADGQIHEIEPKLDDLVQPDDVVYVRESIF